MSSVAANIAEAPADDLLDEIAGLVVTALNLEMPPAELDPDESLFGEEGLGLDSIDALEIALHVEHRYGIKIEAEDADNEERFRSVRTLAAFIADNRQK